MNPEVIRGASPSGIDIAYERFGDRDAPPVLLVMGLATQMLGWPEEFCSALVARGLHVIRFDNRDVGLSTHLHDARQPDVMAALSGDSSSASYTLSDMADDSVGLLDALELDSAHIVGASMGGMIAQTIAIEHPKRAVADVDHAHHGRRDGGSGDARGAQRAAVPARHQPPRGRQPDCVDLQVIGSPGFELDEADLRERAGLAYDRADDPLGVARQLLAIIASGDRTASLRSVNVPTLVLHGADDPLVDVSGGRATADAIPDAELVIFDGMGHDLPRALWPEITARICDVVQRAEARATAHE